MTESLTLSKGNIYDIDTILSHPMKLTEYLKMDKKPDIRIDNEIFFHIKDDFFINVDSRKSDMKESYKYIKSEYVQVVDNWIFKSIYVNFKIEKNNINDEHNNINDPYSKLRLKNKYVYLMLDQRNGYIKIGISNNPSYRETTLQSEKPDIILMAYYNGGIDDEKYLHKLFNNKRIRGEWFSLTSDDIIKINEYFKG